MFDKSENQPSLRVPTPPCDEKRKKRKERKRVIEIDLASPKSDVFTISV